MFFKKRTKYLSGIFAIVEPADLTLYESMLDKTHIQMTETPLVCLYFVNVPLRPVYYQEIAIGLRRKANGQEGWHLVDLCVDKFLPWYGMRWLEGSKGRKFLGSYVTLETSGDGFEGKAIERNGNIFINMNFSPQENFTELKPWQEDYLFRQKYLPSHHHKENPLIGLKHLKKGRKARPLSLDSLWPPNCKYIRGMVQVTSASNHSWTRLVPTGTTVPALYFE